MLNSDAVKTLFFFKSPFLLCTVKVFKQFVINVVVFQGEAGKPGPPGYRGDEGQAGSEVSPTKQMYRL